MRRDDRAFHFPDSAGTFWKLRRMAAKVLFWLSGDSDTFTFSLRNFFTYYYINIARAVRQSGNFPPSGRRSGKAAEGLSGKARPRFRARPEWRPGCRGSIRPPWRTAAQCGRPDRAKVHRCGAARPSTARRAKLHRQQHLAVKRCLAEITKDEVDGELLEKDLRQEDICARKFRGGK